MLCICSCLYAKQRFVKSLSVLVSVSIASHAFCLLHSSSFAQSYLLYTSQELSTSLFPILSHDGAKLTIYKTPYQLLLLFWFHINPKPCEWSTQAKAAWPMVTKHFYSINHSNKIQVFQMSAVWIGGWIRFSLLYPQELSIDLSQRKPQVQIIKTSWTAAQFLSFG